MACIYAKLVSVAHANYFKNHKEFFFVFFLVLCLKSMSLSSLNIMKKSPITKYSDRIVNDNSNTQRCLFYQQDIYLHT